MISANYTTYYCRINIYILKIDNCEIYNIFISQLKHSQIKKIDIHSNMQNIKTKPPHNIQKI